MIPSCCRAASVMPWSARAVDCGVYRAEIVDEAGGAGEAMEARRPGSWLRYRRAGLGAGVDPAVAQTAAVGRCSCGCAPMIPRTARSWPNWRCPSREGWQWRPLEAAASGTGSTASGLHRPGAARLVLTRGRPGRRRLRLHGQLLGVRDGPHQSGHQVGEQCLGAHIGELPAAVDQFMH
jgi:hypothetical protein